MGFGKHYDAAHAELEEILKSAKERQGAARGETATRITISPIPIPPSHPDSNINTAIFLAYLNLTDERSRYFGEIRSQLSKDSRLAPHVQGHLEELGCASTWREIQNQGLLNQRS